MITAHWNIQNIRFRRLHRHFVNEYIMELNNEIDSIAEVDSRKFCKMVNNRKKRQPAVSAGINFGGTIVRDRDLIVDSWCSYFKDLYSPSDDNDYDATFENVT